MALYVTVHMGGKVFKLLMKINVSGSVRFMCVFETLTESTKEEKWRMSTQMEWHWWVWAMVGWLNY